MASTRSSAKNKVAVMRFSCGHSEPDASVAVRVRAAGGRAVWVRCQVCNLIDLVVTPIGSGRVPAKG